MMLILFLFGISGKSLINYSYLVNSKVMSIPIAFTLLVLCVMGVQCDQESPACPRKKSSPGVLALNVGSEVIFDCSGNVTVDKELLVMGTKHKEGPGDATHTQKARKNPDTTEKHQRNTANITTPGANMNTATRTAKVSESVTSANLVMSSAMETVGNGQISLATNQFTKPNSVGRVTEEALSKSMGMGLRTKRSTSQKYEADEDYDENVDGLRVNRSIKRQVQWTRNGQIIADGVEHSGVLRLPALQLNDSGNYSCYRRGKLVSSVKISVGIPPVNPTLKCYKKSHKSNVRCEWISGQPIIPHPQCYLLHRKRLENISRVKCSYSAKASRCWCVLPSEASDREPYSAKLCVTNTAGNVTSALLSYVPENNIKPDPPTRVTVNPVWGQPHTLKVIWSLPGTWEHSRFYILKFQLRYRPKNAKNYQQVNIEEGRMLWLISDALPRVEYEVQIKAKDEFVGEWSEWTTPVYAQTWTASTTAAPDINTSLEPFWTFPEGSGVSEDEDEVRPYDGDNVMWMHVLWVVGFFIVITIISFTVYILRRRVPFQKSMQSVSSDSSCSSPSPLLQQPLITLTFNYPGKEGEGIHLHNVDYFFSSCESYRR